MKPPIKLDESRLQIFHESSKRKIYVAELRYNPKKDIFELDYDKDYTESRTAIPLSPDLSLFKLHHESKKGKLFPSFTDRIPDRANPAYKDYCDSQGISVDETNPIILLGTIGRRGPSSFIYEPVYYSEFDAGDIKMLREEIGVSQHDVAVAFAINLRTLQRIETGTSRDVNTLKRLEIYLKFPEVALWQLKLSSGSVHKNALGRLIKYFRGKVG